MGGGAGQARPAAEFEAPPGSGMSPGDRPVASWPLRCDGRRGERSLTAVSVMSVGVQAGAAELPRLEAFDEEFGPEPATALPEPRRRTGLRFWAWLVVMVAAGSVGALALLWPTSDAGSLLQGLSAATAPRIASRGGDEQVDRLMRGWPPEAAGQRSQQRATGGRRRPRCGAGGGAEPRILLVLESCGAQFRDCQPAGTGRGRAAIRTARNRESKTRRRSPTRDRNRRGANVAGASGLEPAIPAAAGNQNSLSCRSSALRRLACICWCCTRAVSMSPRNGEGSRARTRPRQNRSRARLRISRSLARVMPT